MKCYQERCQNSPSAGSRATDSTNIDQDEGLQSRGIKCHHANYFFPMDNKLIIRHVNIQQLGEDYMLQQCHSAKH